jgi:hypothetical protein
MSKKMTDHPITPPPNLVQQWHDEAMKRFRANYNYTHDLTTQAARWGADQELEACIAWMMQMGYWGDDGKAIPALRAARRPKPPSLKKQALSLVPESGGIAMKRTYSPDELAVIRRALEALPND